MFKLTQTNLKLKLQSEKAYIFVSVSLPQNNKSFRSEVLQAHNDIYQRLNFMFKIILLFQNRKKKNVIFNLQLF